MTQEPKAPEATILSFQEGAWKITKERFEPKEVASLIPKQPERCYIFLRKNDYPGLCDGRETLLNHFGVPKFLTNRACTELNGYFGCRVSYGDGHKMTDCSTWFRSLVKMVRKEPEDPYEDEPEYVRTPKAKKKKYAWFEMGIFTFWTENTYRVLCVDTPHDMPEKLNGALSGRSNIEFRDPFAFHTDLLDQIILYYEISVWRVRDPVRKMEDNRSRLVENVFKEMHDISRHAIHKSEVLTAMINTMTELQRYQTEIHENLPEDLQKNYKGQAKAYADFQIQLLKSLKLRSESNQKRLENEVQLAFNNIVHQDNTVMKSIALLTMVFLPATFLSALFSTTFFAYGDNGWEASHRFWIYWAITVPVTILVLIVYALWIFYGRILEFVKNRSASARLLSV